MSGRKGAAKPLSNTPGRHRLGARGRIREAEPLSQTTGDIDGTVIDCADAAASSSCLIYPRPLEVYIGLAARSSIRTLFLDLERIPCILNIGIRKGSSFYKRAVVACL